MNTQLSVLRLFAVATLSILLFGCVPLASAGSADFDNVAAPCCFGSAVYAPVTGYPPATFLFGVTLDNSGWNNEATSPPNVLATSDFLPTANGYLFGNIDAVFSTPVCDVQFDVINGYGAAVFTADVFNGPVLVAQSSVFLNSFTSPGDTAHIVFPISNITEIIVSSGQVPGSIDFATDTWTWSDCCSTPTPEPSSLLLMGSGVLGLGGLLRRRLLG
jgi:PEP-CTERM motif